MNKAEREIIGGLTDLAERGIIGIQPTPEEREHAAAVEGFMRELFAKGHIECGGDEDDGQADT